MENKNTLVNMLINIVKRADVSLSSTTSKRSNINQV